MDMLGMDEQVKQADLVITGEGCLDDQSLHGKVIAGVADRSVSQGKPCLALAGDVRLGKREASTAGIDSAYSMTEFAGKEAALGQPFETLADLAQRVAKTWGRA
jgi:glycerate kinase